MDGNGAASTSGSVQSHDGASRAGSGSDSDDDYDGQLTKTCRPMGPPSKRTRLQIGSSTTSGSSSERRISHDTKYQKELAETFDFDVLATTDAKHKGCLAGYKALVGNAPGPYGHRNPVLVMGPPGAWIRTPLPENIRKSRRMQFVEGMIKDTLNIMEFRSNNNSWCLKEGTQLKKKKQLVRDHWQQGVLNDGDDVINSFEEYRKDLCDCLQDVLDGFMSEPISLDNTGGKRALLGIMKLCKFVVGKEIEQKDTIDGLRIGMCGSGPTYLGNVKLKVHSLKKCSDEKAIGYLDGSKSWPPHKPSAIHKIKTPGVQCFYTHYPSGEFRYILTGEVKSSADVRSRYDGTEQRSLFDQTWKQTLVGLKNSNVSYGILLQPHGGTIMRLTVDKQNRLDTRRNFFRFHHPIDIAPFRLEEFMDFVETIIGIFLEL